MAEITRWIFDRVNEIKSWNLDDKFGDSGVPR